MSDMQPGKQLDVWLDVENDAEQQALAKGEKGHKRDAVVKTLTAPLQRGSTKNTAIHVKVWVCVCVCVAVCGCSVFLL